MNIEISLGRFLDLLWGYKDLSFLDEGDEIVEILTKINSLLYVIRSKDFEDKPYLGDSGRKLVCIERKESYDNSYEKWKKDKKESDIRINEHNHKKDQIQKIINRLPQALPEEMRRSMAIKLYEERSISALKQLGVNVEDIEWI